MKTPDTFIFRGWKIDEKQGVVRFFYAFDNGIEFCEVVDFHSPLPSHASPLRTSFEASLDALNIAAGISYYKAFLPDKIVFAEGELSSEQRAFFQELYVNGLGEFAYRNKIDVAGRIDFLTADGRRTSGASSSQNVRRLASSSNANATRLSRKSAVLVGGGKDSLVSVEILRASAEPMVLFTVNPKKPIVECATASGLPLLSVERQIDSKLFELNDAGALNGHVPITAIVSLIAVAGAFVHGYDTIVLSNERSANEGNLVHEGREINHQYSKALEFEQALSNYISTQICSELTYFSLLRPLSELQIARLMAKTHRYDKYFTSCNRTFRIRQSEPTARWCCNCPKCRFSFLIFATAMSPDRVERIFGSNLLNDISQLRGYEELVGLSGHKPWECVGELAESSAAFLWLASQPVWSDCVIVRQLASRIRQVMHNPNEVWNQLLTPSSNHSLPARFERLLNVYVGTS
jgi:hypothetical protein